MYNDSFIKESLNKRIPQILGSYFVAGTSLVLFIQYLVDKYQFPSHFPTLALFGVMGILPSVIILAYFHGAPGKDSWTKIEKIGIPINILFLGICLLIGKNQGLWEISSVTENKIQNRHLIILTNPMNWKDIFKENPDVQTFLLKNKTANISNIPQDSIKKITTLLESNLLHEFYDEKLILDFKSNDQDLKIMNEILESSDETKDIALKLYDLHDKPNQTIYVFIAALEKNSVSFSKFVSLMFCYRGNPENGSVAWAGTDMVDEIPQLLDDMSEMITSQIWGLENDHPKGVVLRVDDDIIVFNPNRMKVKRNMTLVGRTIYNLYDNDGDGYTDKDKDLQKRIDDLKDALEYMENHQDKFTLEEINDMEKSLKRYSGDNLGETAQGYHTWIFSYEIKVINVSDSSVVAKLLKLNTPWSKIRPGDIITLN